MKKQLYLLVIVLIAFIACEKPVEESDVRLVKQIIWEDANMNFSYDSQNRLIALEEPDYTVFTIDYPSTNIMRVVHVGNERIYALNSDGYIINEGYEYENGYLKEIDNTVFVWKNGNLISAQFADYYTNIFSYNTIPYKEVSVSLWAFFCAEMGQYSFFPTKSYGKPPKNWVSSVNNTNYRYELDNKGYVTKIYTQISESPETLMCEIQYK